MVRVHINMDEIAQHARWLNDVNRKLWPRIARKVLNDVALDAKQKEIERIAAQKFNKRKENFYKANSRVEFAKPSDDIKKLKSSVGFANMKPKVKRDHAVEDLAYQETGGDIPSKAFIAMPKGRVGNSMLRMPKTENMLTKIGDSMFDSNSSRLTGAKNKKEKFILSAIYAQKGGLVIGNEKLKDGSRGVYKIMSVHKVKKTKKNKAGKVYLSGDTVANIKLYQTLKKGRKAHVKPTKFLRIASEAAQKKAGVLFRAEANKQLARYRK